MRLTDQHPMSAAMHESPGFARCIPLPENRSALTAVAHLADGSTQPVGNPLFLHGPPGCGKTCLVSALAEQAVSWVCVLSANAFPLPWDQADAAQRYEESRDCDLLIVEDLQHLPARAAETLVHLLDVRTQRDLPVVVTANAGPAELSHRGVRLPQRLVNRLAGGLVIALRPMQASSRRLFLQEVAQRRGLRLTDEIVQWLARALTGGGRQLEGALNQIHTVQRQRRKPPTLEELQRHVHVDTDAGASAVERIMRRVGEYFRVAPRQLRAPRRSRELLMARHVSMYLARQLTALSLQEIGACFGGRDHTTVRHACQKVEVAMNRDAQLCSTVHEIAAALT